ncbi:MAG: hypothetical protein ACR2PQ_10560, partial [Myxococcota bacterium]
TLDGSLRPMKTLEELEHEGDTDDWAVPTETIDEADQTLLDDGSTIEYGASRLATGEGRKG